MKPAPSEQEPGCLRRLLPDRDVTLLSLGHLERATGQSHGIDEEAAEFAARWMCGALRPEYRGSAFGAEHAVPADAPSWERLIAFSGRDPEWTAPA